MTLKDINVEWVADAIEAGAGQARPARRESLLQAKAGQGRVM